MDLFTFAQIPAPERWLPVVGYEGLYEVSDYGRVRNARTRHILTSVRTLKGAGRYERDHARVHLFNGHGEKKVKKVHLLVLEAFVGPRPEGMLGLHWDDDKDNNKLDNLRWGTQAENIEDARRNMVFARSVAAKRARREARERMQAAA